MKQAASKADTKANTTGLDLAVNAGLRAVFAERHGVEITSRVPFKETALFDKAGASISLKPNYNIGMRYTYSF